jgi:hypothetical protein
MAVAYTVGRFQPPTIGHAKLIQAVKDTGKAFVFVSSVKPCGKEAANNPLTSTEKIKYLKRMFPSGVEFIDTADCDPGCGGPLAAYKYLKAFGYEDITLIAGSDRAPIFGPDAPIWKSVETPPKFKGLDREAADKVSQMSGTKARGFAKTGDLKSFTAAVMIGNMTAADAKELYDLLRSKKGGGECIKGEEVSMWYADDEMVGGRRTRRRKLKTRRSRKNKASNRV